MDDNRFGLQMTTAIFVFIPINTLIFLFTKISDGTFIMTTNYLIFTVPANLWYLLVVIFTISSIEK